MVWQELNIQYFFLIFCKWEKEIVLVEERLLPAFILTKVDLLAEVFGTFGGLCEQ